jgi:hypothetical protein
MKEKKKSKTTKSQGDCQNRGSQSSVPETAHRDVFEMAHTCPSLIGSGTSHRTPHMVPPSPPLSHHIVYSDITQFTF